LHLIKLARSDPSLFSPFCYPSWKAHGVPSKKSDVSSIAWLPELLPEPYCLRWFNRGLVSSHGEYHICI